MDGESERPRREPRGYVTHVRPLGRPRLRRVFGWLLHDREDIDQEGLLARRTLVLAPSPPRRDVEQEAPDTEP